MDARAWALEAAAVPVDAADWQVASADASFRRYFRLTHGRQSWIVMDAPPQHEDCAPFIHVAALMRDAGLHAPRVLAADPARGFVLLDDLGSVGYLETVEQDAPLPWLEPAVDALVDWQAATRAGALPEYDDETLQREMRLFGDWFVDRHLAITLSSAEADALEQVQSTVLQEVQSQTRVFVHRDFMVRNLMVCDPMPGVIDFQDARVGPYSYDLLSLLRDAFVSWSAATESALVARYADAARRSGVPVPDDEAIWRDLDFMGVQRHLKVLGIFARLCRRDGKDRYLADAPRFIGYLRGAVQRRRELAPLSIVLDRIAPLVAA